MRLPALSRALTGPALALSLAFAGCDSAAPGPALSDATATASATAAAAPGSVAVCHIDDDGAVVKLTLPQRAVDVHLAHGDGRPGDGAYDDACAPVVPCPCWSEADLDLFGSANGSIFFVDTGDGPPSTNYVTQLWEVEGGLETLVAQVGESEYTNQLGDTGKDYCVSFVRASYTRVHDRDITHEEAASCQTSLRAKIAELGLQ